ncbi:phosphatidylinositol 3,4,5-trisphosphate 5-phosphatase 2A-like [Spea bombifrons]|uniref:phosphatidylinositol 3,4,5-trisphosphate 5-phosphatase 2A-like n=1 Tax=Spea bombifrons TaxID=233779 RepID=UPI00234BE6B7|nr:phosphatidylinositol 3,4,5-trisphosphate 5-phosphatase 2A-like [Spea bombifrons]
MNEYWYHAGLSQTCAEQLLIRDGRDGAFLVRPSESVRGAFAICVLFRKQVHTYRVLPEENGLLAVQSVQGVEVKKFPGLSELVYAYKYEKNGMVTSLLYPAGWEGDGRTGHFDLQGGTSPGWRVIPCMDPELGSSHCEHTFFSQNTHVQEDIFASKKQDLWLCSLNQEELGCKKLYRQLEVTWHSLKTLMHVFGHVTSHLHPDCDQVLSLDSLIHNILAVQEILCFIERNTLHILREYILPSPISYPPVSPGIVTTSPNKPTKETELPGVCMNIICSDSSQPRRNVPKNLSVFLGTWNMGGSLPPCSISSWLSSRGSGKIFEDTGACLSHDLYMIGTQENPQGDQEWTDFLKAALFSQTGKQYKVVTANSLGGLKLVLLVKQEYENFITHVQLSNVRTGISNAVGNKGAVGVSFEFTGTSLGFVTCHLVSSSKRVQKRNQSFGDILHSLSLGDEALRSFQLPLRLTHLFWTGDLNYRINMPVQDVLQCVYSGRYHVLLPVDQLNQERKRKKVFLGFKEEPIAFPPTFRYERGSRNYDWQKTKATGTRIFAPSWSDRVLWTSYPDTKIKCTSYGCTDDIVTSDHSPVFATFVIGLKSLLQKGLTYTIRFQNIEAIIKTHHRSQGYIQFQSKSLQGSPQSTVNSEHSNEGTAFLKMGWSEQDLPELTLVGQDPNHNLTGHILLSIKATDGGDSYGECCVSVHALCRSSDHHFQAFMSQRGEETGFLQGRVNLITLTETKLEKTTPSSQAQVVKIKENSSRVSCAADSACDTPSLRSSKIKERRRPASICCSTSSYSNAEYFLLEGTQLTHTPTFSRPHSTLVNGKHQQTAEQWSELGQASVVPPTNKSEPSQGQ